MKFLSTALAVFALLAATTDASPMLRMEAAGKSKKGNVEQQDQTEQQQQDPVEQTSPTTGKGCNLTGTYKKGTDISSCSSITVDSLTVPAGVTLDLSKAKKGAIIEFKGTTTFGFRYS
ncbi:Polygalacturonase [Phytophthora palmivora]|uniref:Polygalacturonase n=1 Tax=Phytophthora palmivora TaxID=4796 RepID=A0A2P4WWK8_9STRA|nr:Polygalacturonase [Phytophthora palmivora]